MRVTAICNLKGGVAKSATTINLGAVLAKEYGKRVLVIDADCQCNTTVFFGVDPARGNVARVLREAAADRDPGVFAAHMIQATGFVGIDLLAAEDSLMDLDLTKAENGTADAAVLKKLVWTVRGMYDAVLIDCPPAFNAASAAALIAADTRTVQREKAKAEKRQAKAEQEAKEAPEREAIRQCYQRVGELRAARGISEEDFIRTSQTYVIAKDVERLPKLETGTVSLNDRLPGGLWPAEARRLAAVADLLGCSVDYLLGRTDTPGIVSNLGTTGDAGAEARDVPNWGTGWRTGDPDEPGTYAVIGEDPGSPTQMLARWDWDGKQWTVYGEPAKNYGFLVQCWIPLPPKVGTCITGMSGSGRCGAAAYCAEPVECCLQCDKDCNGRCGWIGEDKP